MSVTSRPPIAARARLLTAAWCAFGRCGFEEASLDEIAAEAGVTKGSLYHHFRSKRDLFEAVYRHELDRQMGLFDDAYRALDNNSWVALLAGCRAYLDAIEESAARRITIVDAPSVLGRKTVRQIEDRELIGYLTVAIRRAMDRGDITSRPVEPVAHLLFSALCEAATQMDEAQSRELHAAWIVELERFFNSLQ